MAKVNSVKDEVLTSTLTGLTDPKLALLTAASDLNDPATWTEASYVGYTRQSVSFGSITDASGGYREVEWPTSKVSFQQIPLGSSVTLVGWTICEGDGPLTTSARRSVDSTSSKVFQQKSTPTIKQGSLTSRTR